MVNRLSGRERQIVIMRYGLSGTQPLTQQQVADILHQPQLCIPHREKALEELRAMMRKERSAGKGLKCRRCKF